MINCAHSGILVLDKRVPFLSISMIYYLRRLLRQYEACLKPVIYEGAGLVANPEADLYEVLESLYPEAQELAEVTEQLSRLILLHQKKDLMSIDQHQAITQQIFWILGLKYASSSVLQNKDPA